jgi:hypothetical protein
MTILAVALAPMVSMDSMVAFGVFRASSRRPEQDGSHAMERIPASPSPAKFRPGLGPIRGQVFTAEHSCWQPQERKTHRGT